MVTLKTNASLEAWNTFFYKNCLRCVKNVNCVYKNKLEQAVKSNEIEQNVAEAVGFKIDKSAQTFEIKPCALFEFFTF